MINDMAMWHQMAVTLGLKVVTAPDGSEIAIFKEGHHDRGLLWVSRCDMVKIEDGEEVISTVNAGEALGVLARLRRV